MESTIPLGYGYTVDFDIDEVSIDISDLLYNVEIYGMIGRGKTRIYQFTLYLWVSYLLCCNYSKIV